MSFGPPREEMSGEHARPMVGRAHQRRGDGGEVLGVAGTFPRRRVPKLGGIHVRRFESLRWSDTPQVYKQYDSMSLDTHQIYPHIMGPPLNIYSRGACHIVEYFLWNN